MNGELLSLTRDDVRALRALLAGLCEQAEASYAALLQDGGFVLSEAGDPAHSDQGESGALAAGAFFAARQLAARLGEGDFAGLHYEGSQRHFLLAPAGSEHLLLVVFGGATRPAIIRACVRQLLPTLVGRLTALKAPAGPLPNLVPLVPARSAVDAPPLFRA